jgi:hypothetical protein
MLVILAGFVTLAKARSAASHRVFACIEPAIRRAFPTSIESGFA